jgi:hypothetical protein
MNKTLALGMSALVCAGLAACTPRVEVTSFHGEAFSAIWGASADDVWVAAEPYHPELDGLPMAAIRRCGPDAYQTATILRRWDGRQWTKVPTSADRRLDAIAGSGTNDVWFAGLDGLVLHWDGQRIDRVDVSAVAHHDGMTDLCHDAVAIQSLWSPAPGQIWAVGFIAPSATGPALILHHDGVRWTRHRIDFNEGLTAVWGSGPNDVWAMGPWNAAFHYDGTTWTRADNGTTAPRKALWGSGPNDIWSVGEGDFTHFDGRTWSPHHQIGGRWYHGLSGRHASEVWAVGFREGNKALVSHYDGVNWSDVDTGDLYILNDVWATPAGGAWAAGRGMIARLR